MMPGLLELPEEVIEIIIFLVASAPASLPSSHSVIGRAVQLFPAISTHSTLHRIGVPLLYHSIILTTCETAYLFYRTLQAFPHYASHIRAVYARAMFPSLPFILRSIATATPRSPFDTLSISLDSPADDAVFLQYAQRHIEESEPNSMGVVVAKALASALLQLAPGPREFVVARRRPPLERELERLRAYDAAIAGALSSWTNLRSATLSFRPPVDSVIVAGLGCAPCLERISTPLPVTWHNVWLVTSQNPALKRMAMTTTRMKARAPDPLFVPVVGRVKESWFTAFPASAAAANAFVASGAGSSSDASRNGLRSSLEERLRRPVEVVSPYGTFIDRTDRVLVPEEHPLSREKLLQSSDENISDWLVEARKHPRLLELMLAESDAVEGN